MRSSRYRLAAASGDERAAVREHDLRDDAVVLELLDAAIRVPLARGAAHDVVFGLVVRVVLLERLAREQEPAVFRGLARLARELDALAVLFVEGIEILRLDEGPEVFRPADRVAVGRDHDETVHDGPPMWSPSMPNAGAMMVPPTGAVAGV